jgi:chromate transport protein ChrA
MITPGPVVITVAFIGYFNRRYPSRARRFSSCLPRMVLLAPFYRRYSNNLKLRAFVEGVTAAAVGAITGAVRDALVFAGADRGRLYARLRLRAVVFFGGKAQLAIWH